jgi:hypothetical protein
MAISYVTAASLDGTQNGSAPIYGARAWVNFNGTGTAAIRASGNVSSITDGGTGDFTVNLTNAISDANYSCLLSFGDNSGATNNGFWASRIFSRSTTAVRFLCGRPDTGAQSEPSDANVAIFR